MSTKQPHWSDAKEDEKTKSVVVHFNGRTETIDNKPMGYATAAEMLPIRVRETFELAEEEALVFHRVDNGELLDLEEESAMPKFRLLPQAPELNCYKAAEAPPAAAPPAAATESEVPATADSTADPEGDAPAASKTPVDEAAEEPAASPSAQEEEASPAAAVAEEEAAAVEQAPEEDKVINEDVEAEYGNHYFTKADIADITKVQAVYRRQANSKKVAQQAEVKKGWEKELAAKKQRGVEAIEMPPEDIMPEEAAAAEIAAQEESEKRKGAFTTIDYSKRLKVQTMSADTKGMQRMYSRMLKTKTWW